MFLCYVLWGKVSFHLNLLFFFLGGSTNGSIVYVWKMLSGTLSYSIEISLHQNYPVVVGFCEIILQFMRSDL